ncbi:MAG: hypothetical protein J5933_04655 [Clostridia bacterium]|nr:hypothetical protein [Clostridia bacterium]
MAKNNEPESGEHSGKAGRIVSRLLLVVLILAVLFFIYTMSVALRFYEIVITVYYCLLGAGIIALFVLYRGAPSKSTDPADLPEDWDQSMKDSYIADEKKRRSAAKIIAMFVFPLVLIVFVDLVDLYFGDVIKRLFPFLGQ